LIKLYQFPKGKIFPNISPYCVKLETYFKISGLPYEKHYERSTKNSPKGKMPYIKDGDLTLGDTTFIIEYLKKQYQIDIDSHLNELEKSQSLAFQRLLEENLFYIHAYFRWLYLPSWAQFKKVIFGRLPFVFKLIVPKLMQNKFKKRLKTHALGDHSPEELIFKANTDLLALDIFIGEKEYFFGEKPSSLDAIVFGVVGNIVFDVIKSPLTDLIRKYPRLVTHSERMLKRYYS
jgi:glutathione S-transferase